MNTSFAAFFILLALPLSGFTDTTIWQDVKPKSIVVRTPRRIIPKAYRTVRLNFGALRRLLARAPMEFTAAAKKSAVVLALPLPDGKWARFRIHESPISAPDPSGKVSDFKTYSGQGIDDRTATLRCDVSRAGFHAQILFGGESVYLDPFAPGDTAHYISYYKRDLTPRMRPPESRPSGK
jgi:hypothetical protein